MPVFYAVVILNHEQSLAETILNSISNEKLLDAMIFSALPKCGKIALFYGFFENLGKRP